MNKDVLTGILKTVAASLLLAVIWGGWQVREDVRAIRTVLALCGVCGEPGVSPGTLLPTILPAMWHGEPANGDILFSPQAIPSLTPSDACTLNMDQLPAPGGKVYCVVRGSDYLIPTPTSAPDCCFGRDLLTKAAYAAVERIDAGDPSGAKVVLEDALRVSR